jgi:O-methyltransferase domain
VEGGSFLEHVPDGADIYLLIRVLHDWDDEHASQILSRCREVMNTHVTLLIGEELLQPDPSRGHVTAYLIDTHMMTMFGHGRARTEGEFRGLLDRSGFLLRRVVPTTSSVSLLEAVPVS